MRVKWLTDFWEFSPFGRFRSPPISWGKNDTPTSNGNLDSFANNVKTSQTHKACTNWKSWCHLNNFFGGNKTSPKKKTHKTHSQRLAVWPSTPLVQDSTLPSVVKLVAKAWGKTTKWHNQVVYRGHYKGGPRKTSFAMGLCLTPYK